MISNGSGLITRHIPEWNPASGDFLLSSIRASFNFLKKMLTYAIFDG
jgi:hypothetical protein